MSLSVAAINSPIRANSAPEDRAIRARVSVSLEGRFVGLPLERLAREVDELVLTFAAGAEEVGGVGAVRTKIIEVLGDLATTASTGTDDEKVIVFA
ncbi:hypothetical protein B5K11_05150 [Rhizobium leguminosarum bv. trifolii]|nr:hypothetical protein B5K11_05150 [Rhizobium leguminosarum bv. trifolii]